MFGNNPQRQQDLSSGLKLWVQEVFYTLQGEGPFTGTPAVFVRLVGCNLACYFCDTDFESSEWKPSLQELVDKIGDVNERRSDLVVITGGEPFRQNIIPLVLCLNEQGYRVQVETAGTLYLMGAAEAFADEKNTLVCSPKTPGIHPKIEPLIDAFKYIVKRGCLSPEDGLPLGSTQMEGDGAVIFRPPAALKRDVYLQPMDEDLVDGEQATMVNIEEARDACLKFGYRLCLQTHKLVNLP